MGYTGYKVIQYIDDNPNSPTYGETWTELVLDTEHCPNDSGDWELVSSECELSTSGYTGLRINTYYNNVTGEYSSTTSADSSCKTSSLDEIWTNSGDSYCEQDEDGKYTGYGLQRQVQTNSNLINYTEIRDVRVAKTECMDELEPVWQDLYKVCHIESSPSGQLYYNGTADILQIDINPSSESYNQTRTINVPDEECIVVVCDDIVEEWKYVDDYCGNQVPASYNLSNLTFDTVYHIYQKYQKCIVEGETVRESPTGIYSAQTYQTGVSDCQYRWIDTEETVCVAPPFEGKFKATYSGGSTYSAECDSSTTLLSGETRPEGYVYSSMTDAEIGSCVTSVGGHAFIFCYSLSSCTIGSGVTSIGHQAFFDCSGLTSVNIPSSVTTISDRAFEDCYRLTSITIPSGVTSIGNFIFSQCSGLTSVNIPSGVTSIGDGAFYYCNRLTSVNIPSGVTSIGESAFYGCSGLTSIDIPNGVTSIGTSTFSNCRSLTSCTIGSGVTSIGNSAFYKCSGLISITIPSSVTTINGFAFFDCSGLTTVTIGSGVTSIDSLAFADCSNLAGITINATTPPTLGNSVFSNTNNAPIYVPSGSVSAYKSAWSTYSSRITAIPNS